MSLESIAGCFDFVKKTGKNQYSAACPCPHHTLEDNKHLALTERADGAVGIHCFAGCYTDEILSEVGLKLKDLFPAVTEVDKQHWREKQAQKRAEEHEYALGFNFWLELSVLKQALEGRLWGEDKHPTNKTECWDREKQAMRLLPKYFKEYYK